MCVNRSLGHQTLMMQSIRASCARHARCMQARRRPKAASDTSALSRTEDTGIYRDNVGICIVNSDGLVFGAVRVDDVQNTWQMPQVSSTHGQRRSVGKH